MNLNSVISHVVKKTICSEITTTFIYISILYKLFLSLKLNSKLLFSSTSVLFQLR